MVTINEFREWALSFPDAEELPHFDIPSFRFKKKIFATFRPKENRAMLKLPPVEQSVYCDYNSDVFHAVQGTWGRQGATFVELKLVRKDVFEEALTVAYKAIAEKKKK